MSQLSPQADHVLISLNPKAGRSDPARRAEELRGALVRLGYAVEILTDLKTVAEKANGLVQAGRLRALVGVGGDGTAAELVNRTVPGCPVTLLPAGTANLLAKEYRLPKEPKKLAEMIRVGSTVTFDAGRFRVMNESGPAESGRLFLVLVSVGVDAWIVRRVDERREASYRAGTKRGGHIGYLSYLKPIFEAIFSYSYAPMSVEIEGGSPRRLSGAETSRVRREWAKWAFVCNIPRYGFGAAPVLDSRPDDRLLDVCLFKRGGFLSSIFSVALAFCGGLHRFCPSVRLGSARVLRVTAGEGEKIPFEADGDPAGFLPVEIETVPARVTLIVPDRFARRRIPSKNRKAEKVAAEPICPAELSDRGAG